MLLITRRSGEAIVINGTIEVKVLEVKSGRVKLGFEYPVGSTVFRKELFAKIQDENKAAALAVDSAVFGADIDVLGKVVRNLQQAGRGKGDIAHAKTKPNQDVGHDAHNRNHDDLDNQR